jgi:metal-dependent HD superfamily phosphatase/phosphodiesterase
MPRLHCVNACKRGRVAGYRNVAFTGEVLQKCVREIQNKCRAKYKCNQFIFIALLSQWSDNIMLNLPGGLTHIAKVRVAFGAQLAIPRTRHPFSLFRHFAFVHRL